MSLRGPHWSEERVCLLMTDLEDNVERNFQQTWERASGTSVAVFVGYDIVPPDNVGVGVAVGGHGGTVPRGGHGKGDVCQENILAAPCVSEHNQPSLQLENQELDLRLACSV